MKSRLIVIAAVVSLLVAAAAVAQPDRHGAGKKGIGRKAGQPGIMRPGMGRMGPMPGSMGMRGMAMSGHRGVEMTCWDGNIYVLHGRTLQKLNSEFEPVKTVELEPGGAKKRMGKGMMMHKRKRRMQGKHKKDMECSPKHKKHHAKKGKMECCKKHKMQGGQKGEMECCKKHKMQGAKKKKKSAKKKKGDKRHGMKGAMQGQRKGMMRGQGAGRGSRSMKGPEMPQGMRTQMRQMMRQRMRGMMTVGEPAIDADNSGIYVFRAGTITVFAHDLDKLRAGQLPRPGMTKPMKGMKDKQCCGADGMKKKGAKARPKSRKSARKAGCPRMDRPDKPHHRRKARRGQMSDPVSRTIASGKVNLRHKPADVQTGRVQFWLGVADDVGNRTTDARVSAFVYPDEQPQNGTGIKLHKTRCKHFVGDATLDAPGKWELSVRIERPGMEDELVYYPFTVNAE